MFILVSSDLTAEDTKFVVNVMAAFPEPSIVTEIVFGFSKSVLEEGVSTFALSICTEGHDF